MSSSYYKLTPEEKKKRNKKNTIWEFEKKLWAVSLKGGKCEICGYDKCVAALDFHHLDPSTKEHSWTTLRKQSRKTVIKELQKCILVCSNCHREIHFNEYDHKKNYSPKIKLDQFYQENNE